MKYNIWRYRFLISERERFPYLQLFLISEGYLKKLKQILNIDLTNFILSKKKVEPNNTLLGWKIYKNSQILNVWNPKQNTCRSPQEQKLVRIQNLLVHNQNLLQTPSSTRHFIPSKLLSEVIVPKRTCKPSSLLLPICS